MEQLTTQERQQLLAIARRAVEASARKQPLDAPNLNDLPERLRQNGVAFVTLTGAGGELRGCIGALEAVQALALDVFEHAAAAATEDYRFAPIQTDELDGLQIEISRLTNPVPLDYQDPEDLPSLLKPHVDGVVLRDGFRRATFLPQVWEKLPDPSQFLSHLCQKMGLPADAWRRRLLKVEIYHVEEFHDRAA